MNQYHCEVTYTPRRGAYEGTFVCDIDAEDSVTAIDVARRQCQRRRDPEEIVTAVCAIVKEEAS